MAENRLEEQVFPSPPQQAAPLRDQVAIITGASHGIGEAVARRLAALGSHVVLAARSANRLQRLAGELQVNGVQALAIPTDLRQPAAIDQLVQSCMHQFQRIDMLVNNAGLGAFRTPLHETPVETWDAVMDTNLRAVYLAMRAVVPIMIQRCSGHIINISSLAAHNPVPFAAAYAASKWALNGLSVSAAEELRSYGIRVSLVCPGSVDTELVPDQHKDRAKMLRPDDIAHAVVMLVTQRPGSFISEVLLRPTQKP